MTERKAMPLVWQRNANTGLCRTRITETGATFILPKELAVVEVQNMTYDEVTKQLTVTAKPGELAVAYCQNPTDRGAPRWGTELDYDAIYFFEVEEEPPYSELSLDSGKTIHLRVEPGQRFYLPDGKQIEAFEMNTSAVKVNENVQDNTADRNVFFEEKNGRLVLAVGISADGQKKIFGKRSQELICVLKLQHVKYVAGTEEVEHIVEYVTVVFDVVTPRTTRRSINKNSQNASINARCDLRTGPNHFLKLVADEGSVFLVHDHLEVRSVANATYDVSDRTVTIHRKEGEKTRVVFSAVYADGTAVERALAVCEFDVLRKPENPYLPEIKPDEELIVKCKRGSRFTLPGKERSTDAGGFSLENLTNARSLWLGERQVIEIGVDKTGEPIKAKRGKGRAELTVDLGFEDGLSESIYTPVLAKYIFQY